MKTKTKILFQLGTTLVLMFLFYSTAIGNTPTSSSTAAVSQPIYFKAILSFALATSFGEVYGILRHLTIVIWKTSISPQIRCKRGSYFGEKGGHLVFPQIGATKSRTLLLVGKHCWYLKNVLVADDRVFASLHCETSNVETGKITIISNAVNQLEVQVEFKNGKSYEDYYVRSI